jgi:hypothetical protein
MPSDADFPRSLPTTGSHRCHLIPPLTARSFGGSQDRPQRGSAHPGIPAVAWIHGEEYEPRRNPNPFWIDIRLPTVREYLSVAERLLDRGLLQQENSFVLTARQQSKAIDAMDLGQLRSLNKNLVDIFGLIAQGTSTEVSAPGDIVVGAATLPCEACQ